MLKLEKSPIYTQYVESTAFTTKQMIKEKNCKFCNEKIYACDRNMVSTYTFTRSSGDHMTTKYVNR
jgi:hypothetical protein